MKKNAYLDFERPIAQLEEKIDEIKAQAAAENLDVRAELASLEAQG